VGGYDYLPKRGHTIASIPYIRTCPSLEWNLNKPTLIGQYHAQSMIISTTIYS